MTKKLYRQGDVGIMIAVDGVPVGAEKVGMDNGRLILAHGEVTGHAHEVVCDGEASLYEVIEPGDVAEMRERFLVVSEEAQVRHEEHSTITLQPGAYRVIRQREYDPDGHRHVAD